MKEPLEDLVHASSIVLVNGKEVCQSHAAELLPRQSVVGLAPEEGAVEVLGVGEVEDPVQDLPGLPVLGVLVHPAGEGLGLAGFLVQVCGTEEGEELLFS